MLTDARYAIRSLSRSPGLVTTAVLMLALGTGANTALFSIVDAVLLRPLPFPASERLMLIAGSPEPGFPLTPISFPEFSDLREQSQAFEHVAAWSSYADTRFNVTGMREPENVQYALVSANFFATFGIEPRAGRLFEDADDRLGASRSIVVSQRFWERRFGADRPFSARPLTLEGRPYDIVGVLPSHFRFITYPQQPDIFVPLALDPAAGRHYARGARFLGVVARLKPGVTVTDARGEQAVLVASLARQNPGFYRTRTFEVLPLHEHVTAAVRPSVLALWGAVVFVLLIACANVANLLLARARGRTRDVAIRAALGAGRFRIVRQLLTESLLIAAAGSAVGLLVAVWATDIVGFLAEASPSPFVPYDFTRDQFGLNGRVLAFSVLCAGLTGVLAGVLPAVKAVASDLGDALRPMGTPAAGPRGRAGRVLVVAEIALSLVLLVGAGLMLQTLLRLQRVDPGFEPRNLLTVELSLPRAGYADPERAARFAERLVGNVRVLPGVTAVGITDVLPFGGADQSTGFFIDGRPLTTADQTPDTHQRSVTPGYFPAMGIDLVAGRLFSERDTARAARVAIINEAMARQIWPGERPIGKRVALDLEAWRFYPDRPPEMDMRGGLREIVGVVADVRHASLQAGPTPEMYIPQAQRPSRQMILVVRTTSDPARLADVVRATVRRIDPDQPVSALRTMTDLVNGSLAPSRLNAQLISAFSAVALALALVGLYGVMAHSVLQRTQEMGIRMALGASRRNVVAMVLREGGLLILLGLALGTGGALVAARLAASLLFGVSPTDPLTLASTGVLLGAVAVLACYVPARRAARMDPVVALRYD